MNFEKVNKVLDEVLDSSSDYENDEFSNISDEEKVIVLETFNSMANKEEQ